MLEARGARLVVGRKCRSGEGENCRHHVYSAVVEDPDPGDLDDVSLVVRSVKKLQQRLPEHVLQEILASQGML